VIVILQEYNFLPGLSIHENRCIIKEIGLLFSYIFHIFVYDTHRSNLHNRDVGK